MSKTERVIVEPSRAGKITTSRIEKVVQAVHVIPAKQGGWTVKQGGREKVEAHFPRKSAAVSYGRELSRNKHTVMFVHTKDGKVQEINGTGQPPHPSQG